MPQVSADVQPDVLLSHVFSVSKPKTHFTSSEPAGHHFVVYLN